MDEYNLNRFVEAQMVTYEGAMLELARGRKRVTGSGISFLKLKGLVDQIQPNFILLKV